MSDDSREYKFKILLLGNKNVGKTSLLYRLKNRTAEFVPFIPLTPRCTNKNEYTDYIFKEMRIGNKIVKFQIWDYNFNDTTNLPPASYFDEVSGVIFLCDITDPLSLASLESWWETTSSYILNYYHRIVLANKLDLGNIDDWNDTVANNKLLLKRIDPAFCLPISSKTGQYLEEALKEFGAEMIKFGKTQEYDVKKSAGRNSTTSCIIS